MNLSALFHVFSYLAVPAWALLIVAPRWRWSPRFATFIFSIPLGAVYIGLFCAYWNSALSIGSLDQVYAILQNPAFILIAWIHYLVMNLFAGSWEVQDAQRIGIPHAVVIPCLLGTAFFGPVGLMLYLLLRFTLKKKLGTDL